jgi:hypothetical protein
MCREPFLGCDFRPDMSERFGDHGYEVPAEGQEYLSANRTRRAQRPGFEDPRSAERSGGWITQSEY